MDKKKKSRQQKRTNVWYTKKEEDMDKLMSADNVRNELGVSKSKAYQIIKKLNDELEGMGYLIVRGKIDKEYFNQRFFYNKEAIQAKNAKLRC